MTQTTRTWTLALLTMTWLHFGSAATAYADDCEGWRSAAEEATEIVQECERLADVFLEQRDEAIKQRDQYRRQRDETRSERDELAGRLSVANAQIDVLRERAHGPSHHWIGAAAWGTFGAGAVLTVGAAMQGAPDAAWLSVAVVSLGAGIVGVIWAW